MDLTATDSSAPAVVIAFHMRLSFYFSSLNILFEKMVDVNHNYNVKNTTSTDFLNSGCIG